MKSSFGKKNEAAGLPLSADFHRHACAPRHAECLQNADGSAVGVGSCGDSIAITLRIEGEIIAEIGCRPEGCEYTVACASAVRSLALGRTTGKALELQPEDVERELGGLPEDHRHCARLAVNTLGDAIADTYRQPSRKTP